jgi:hypothetical protein
MVSQHTLLEPGRKVQHFLLAMARLALAVFQFDNIWPQQYS